MKKSEVDIIAEAIEVHLEESNGIVSGRPLGDWRSQTSKSWAEHTPTHPDGARVRVPHKGKMVSGKVVRHDKGSPQESSFYVVDVGEYESVKVPAHKVEKLQESRLFENEQKPRYALTRVEPQSGSGKIEDHYLRHDNSFGPYDPKLTKGFRKGNPPAGDHGDDFIQHMDTHWPHLDHYDAEKMKRRYSWQMDTHPDKPDHYRIKHEGSPTHFLHSDGEFKGLDKEKTKLFDTPEAAHEYAKSKKLLNTKSKFSVSQVYHNGQYNRYADIITSNSPIKKG